jgi:hypothetical protein
LLAIYHLSLIDELTYHCRALKALPLEPTERTGVSVLLALSVGVSIMGTYASLATLADDFSSFGPPFHC